MYSNECFMFHRIYERIKSSAVPLILSFIGFSLLYFIKYFTNVGIFWCYTDFIATVIIIGIIAFFERLLNENQQLRNQIAEKNATIKERDLNIKQSKITIKELEKKLEISNEQFKDAIRYNRQNSKNIENPTLKEIEQLQNQILKNLDALNILTIQNESMKEELFASNKLSEERRKLLLIKDEEIKLLKENLKIKTEENQQKTEIIASNKLSEERRKQISIKEKEIKLLKENLKIKTEENQQKTEIIKENEQLRNQISIMNTDFQQSTIKIISLKQKLENELLIKDEQNHEILKETDRICKNLSNQEMIIFETNKEIKELEKIILKFKNEQEFHQNETLQMKNQNQSTKCVQTSPENFVSCENCEKQKKIENDEKETELNENRGTEISNVTNNMSSPSQSILTETDDDFPPPPSFITKAKFLDQTSSTSKFTSSTPMSLKPSTIFESNVKMPPPIAPKPKFAPPSPAPSKLPPPPPPSVEYFNTSFPSNQSPSSNITPKRAFQNTHRILSADLQAEIQTPRKLKCVKKEIEERKKAKIQTSNEIPDFQALLSQRANKVNTNISFEDKENDSDDEEWK